MSRTTVAFLAAALLVACVGAGCVSHRVPDRRELAEMVQSGPGGRTWGDAQEENYVVVGDGVAVVDNLNPEDLTLAPQIVDIDGTIEMPFLGSVHVAGMTQKELEAELTKRYAPYYEGGADDLDIKVRITSRAKFFYVFGEVREAGRRVLAEETTVMDAVMGSSPLSDSANIASCRLIRGDPLDPLVIQVNVYQIVTEGNSTFNLTVREKDIIYVPPTWLAEVGYFLRRVFFPVEQVFGVILSSLRSYDYITDEDFRQGGGRVIF
jgi:protein involved in polysaccharide export with SLBB domain